MSAASDKAFAYLVGVESSKLSLDPKDRGNWTGGRVGVGELRGSKYGVSAAAHPTVDIANLTFSGAGEIFYNEYWLEIHGDQLPYPVALCLADDAYNHGPPTAIRTLQHALGVQIDGDFGPGTLSAALAANVRSLVKTFQGLRGVAYAHDPNVDRYGTDWFRERVVGTAMAAISQEE
jgi:lysozyme family protein